MALVEHSMDATDLPGPDSNALTSAGQGGSRDPGFLMFTLFRYRWWVILGIACGAAIGFFFAAVSPNTYLATGRLLYRPGVRETTSPDYFLTGDSRAASSMAQAVSTELQILDNHEIYAQVLDTIGIDRLLYVPDPRRFDDESTPFVLVTLHEFQAWWFGFKEDRAGLMGGGGMRDRGAVQSMLEKLLRPVAPYGSNVIEVSFESVDPNVAKEVVDAFIQAATDRDVREFHAKGQVYTKKREDAWRVAETAAKELKEFNEANGIYDLTLQRASLAARIDEGERGIQENRNELSRLASAKEYLLAAITAIRKEPEQVDSAEVNPEYARLRAEVSTLQLRYLDLVPGPRDSPEEFKERKESIETMIAVARASLDKTVVFTKVPNEQRGMRLATLEGRLNVVEESSAGLSKVISQQEAQVATARQTLDSLNAKAPRSQMLTALADHRTQTAEGFSARLEIMEMLLDQQLGNLQVLDSPKLPLERVGPRRSKQLFIGILFGAAVGVILAFARSVSDPTLRRPSELKRLGGRPVLAVTRRMSSGNDLARVLRGERAPSGPIATLVDELRQYFLVAVNDDGPRRIAFVGCEPGVGCTTSTVAAALALSGIGADVLIIGRREMRAELGLEGGAAKGSDSTAVTVGPRLHAMMLGQDPADDAIAQVADAFEYILFDIGPVEWTHEFAADLGWAEGHVFVVAGDVTPTLEIEKRLRFLKHLGRAFLGTIFNRYRVSRPFWAPGQDPELHVR